MTCKEKKADSWLCATLCLQAEGAIAYLHNLLRPVQNTKPLWSPKYTPNPLPKPNLKYEKNYDKYTKIGGYHFFVIFSYFGFGRGFGVYFGVYFGDQRGFSAPRMTGRRSHWTERGDDNIFLQLAIVVRLFLLWLRMGLLSWHPLV